MSTIFRDQPQTSREKVVYWIEYVLKYGGAHLRSAALDMELYEWLMLDIIAFSFVVLIVVILALEACVGCIVYRKCRSAGQKDKEKRS